MTGPVRTAALEEAAQIAILHGDGLSGAAADCGCEACLVLREWARAGAKDGGGQ